MPLDIVGKMEKSKSFFGRIGHRASRTFGAFSSIWFWFPFVLISYFLLAGNDLLDVQYTEKTWWKEFYSITSAFLVGGLISFLFYFLVVHLPERRKRLIIKSNLKGLYADIKRDIAYQIIFASQNGGRTDLSADSETVERLLTIDGFKAAFEGGHEADEGFYAFANGISGDVPQYREIILCFQILSKQIDFVLHNYPISDAKVFDFFKRLEVFLMRIGNLGPGYDEEKVLCRFIWEIFTGWNFIEGYRGYDPIEKMIGDI